MAQWLNKIKRFKTTEVKNIDINVFYNMDMVQKSVSLQLSPENNIGDLKASIFQHSNICPSEQVIEGWQYYPENDSVPLAKCCHLDEENILVVFKQQADHVTDDSHIALKSSETLNEFHGVNFEALSLREAAAKSCSEVKALMLFLHNGQDDFARDFPAYISNPNVCYEIREHFCLLAWNISDKSHTKILTKALEEFSELAALKEFLAERKSRAFILLPRTSSHDQFSLLSCFDGSMSRDSFLTSIRIIINEICMMKRTANNESPDEKPEEAMDDDARPNSEKFLQTFLYLMGDHDYRNFDKHEHDLLKKEIAFALYGMPMEENTEAEEESKEAEAVDKNKAAKAGTKKKSKEGEDTDANLLEGYTEKQRKETLYLYEKIVKENNSCAKWKDRIVLSFLFFCTEPLENKDGSFAQWPLFILRKCKQAKKSVESPGKEDSELEFWTESTLKKSSKESASCKEPCRIFIDVSGRVYQSWSEFVGNVKLPKCSMVLPLNGRYVADDEGRIVVERHPSPACRVVEDVLKGTDIAASVVGAGSAGVAVAAAIPALVVAPPLLLGAAVVGAGVGLYSVVRSAFRIHDRRVHKEEMSLKNSDARGDYFNVAAGFLGVVAPGANFALAELAAKGVNVGQVTTHAFTALSAASVLSGGAALANSTYTVIDKYFTDGETPTAFEIFQLSTSILFFSHAVLNFRTAGTIIEESQANTLKAYGDSLRSNRHRKTFDKITKQTLRETGGNVRQANAQVIKTVRNFGASKDEIFAALTRNNKRMNEQGVKFSARNGNICLNGVPIEMELFTKMDSGSTVTFLNTLPEQQPQELLQTDVNAYKSKFSNVTVSLMERGKIVHILLHVMSKTETSIKEKFIDITALVLNNFALHHFQFLNTLNRWFRPGHVIFELYKAIESFIEKLIEQKQREWGMMDDELKSDDEIVKMFHVATKVFFSGGQVTENALRALTQHCVSWMGKLIYEKELNEERREERHKSAGGRAMPQIDCTVCGGHYYGEKK